MPCLTFLAPETGRVTNPPLPANVAWPGKKHRIQPRQSPKQPSFRRKPESRKSPGKERAGYRGFWIPAFAGTTVLCCDCPGCRTVLTQANNPLMVSLSNHAYPIRRFPFTFLLQPAQAERGGQIKPLCRYSPHLFGIIIRVGAGFKPALRSTARTYRKPSMPGLTFLAPETGRVCNPPLPANHLPGWCKVRDPLKVRNPFMVSLSNHP